MPVRFGDLKRWVEKQGATVEKPTSGSHWKIHFADGSVFPVAAHNGLKSEIKDGYLRDIAGLFGLTLDELRRKL